MICNCICIINKQYIKSHLHFDNGIVIITHELRNVEENTNEIGPNPEDELLDENQVLTQEPDNQEPIQAEYNEEEQNDAEQQPIDQDENPTEEPNNEEDNEPKETPEAELQEKSENEVIINNNILDS